MYRIEAPNREYTGTVAGVGLVKGVADVAEVPNYFRRHHGYKVTRITMQEPQADSATVPGQAARPSTRKATK